VLFVKAARHIQKPREVQFLGDPIQWVKTARYLGLTLYNQLSWSAHVNQVGKKAAQSLGVLGPLLNRRSGLSVRNGVLLYKQLIRLMIYYSFLIWRSAVSSHFRKLQALQSKCLCIATNGTWYVGNKQIHEDLGISFFADHIRALTGSFDRKKADAGNPLFRQLGRHLCQRWVTELDWCSAGHPRLSLKKPAKLVQRVVSTRLPWLRFSVLFLSCKANARV
jgi:hypothetical protein